MLVLRSWMSVGFGVVVVLVAASPSRGFTESPVRLPAAGVLVVGRVAVRVAPRPDAGIVGVLREFRSGGQFQVILAVRASRDSGGGWWYELSLPGRPNGKRGWVPGGVVDLRSVPNRIVVQVRERSLQVRRIADGRVLLRAAVAVGKRSSETPIGRDFYVQARYVPT